MPRADLALPVLTISTCAPRVNATRTVGQGLSVTELEKFLLARYSLELHLIYYHTCKRLFANRSVESVLQSAGERSSESCRKLALAKPLSANELHPGNVSFAWGNCTPIMLPWKLVRSLAWWLVSVEGSGTHGTGHTWAEQGRTSRPASPAQGGNTSISSPRLAFLGKKHVLLPPQEEPVYLRGKVQRFPTWGAWSVFPEQFWGVAAMSSSSGGCPLPGGSSCCHVHMNNRVCYWCFAPFLCSFCRLAYNAPKPR